MNQQQLLYNKLCSESYPTQFAAGHCSDDEFIVSHPEIQADASIWLLYLKLAESVPSIIVSQYVSVYCDIVGQRLPLLLTILAHVVAYAATAVIAWFPHCAVRWLLLPAIFNGCFGSFVTVMLIITSILSRRSTVQARSTPGNRGCPRPTGSEACSLRRWLPVR